MMSALSTMSWTFTMMMKCWWSYFSDFDMCWRQHCLQCHGHSPWNVGWSYFSDFDVCWCQHCLQCHGHSPWNVGGHTSVTLTCVGQYCLQCEGHSPWNVGGHTSVTWTCVDVGIAVKEIRNLNPQDIRSCKLWGIQDWTRFNRTDNKIMIFF